MATPTVTREERTLPLVTYVLMLLGIVTGATAVLALIIATISRKTASDTLSSHYEFVIQTFWVGFFSFAVVLALAVSYLFLPLAWLPDLGRLVFVLASLWVVVRCTIGILRLRTGDGIVNPHTLGVPAPVDQPSAV